MPPENTFQLFSAPHLATLLVILGVALIVPLVVRVFVPAATRPVAYLLAAALLAQEAITVWIWIDIIGLSAQLLPLHMCTLTLLLSAWMLIGQDRRIFELVYFWGLGGTTQALLTPDLQEGFPAASYLLFFLGHGGTMVALSFAMLVFRFRPYLESIPRVIAITGAVAALAFAVNLWQDTNFMYLMAKPMRPSILDWFGAWPWYLLGLVMLSLISILLLYLPFLVFDLLKGRASFKRSRS